MATETKGLIQRYTNWLMERSSEREIDGGWKVLTLPFLDSHNDHLQVFVREERDGLHITDEGQTISGLKQVGCDLKAPTKRRMLAEKILKGMGLSPDLLDKGSLETTAVNGEFPRKLHNLLLSMLAIDGIADISSSNAVASFKDNVGDWLKLARVPVIDGAKFTGKSGEQHEFDFMIPPTTPSGPIRVIHAIPHPDKVHVQSFTYSVIDTRDLPNENRTEFFAILNDQGSSIQKRYMTLLSHDITPIPWSRRDQHVRKLA
jgi:hypothetical protein